MSNQTESKWDSLLTDVSEKEDGVEYITPNIDIKLPANKRNECREIVKEIKTFGINQRQLLYLIYLLSLELENRETMVALTKTIGQEREKTNISKLILPEEDND